LFNLYKPLAPFLEKKIAFLSEIHPCSDSPAGHENGPVKR